MKYLREPASSWCSLVDNKSCLICWFRNSKIKVKLRSWKSLIKIPLDRSFLPNLAGWIKSNGKTVAFATTWLQEFLLKALQLGGKVYLICFHPFFSRFPPFENFVLMWSKTNQEFVSVVCFTFTRWATLPDWWTLYSWLVLKCFQRIMENTHHWENSM